MIRHVSFQKKNYYFVLETVKTNSKLPAFTQPRNRPPFHVTSSATRRLYYPWADAGSRATSTSPQHRTATARHTRGCCFSRRIRLRAAVDCSPAVCDPPPFGCSPADHRSPEQPLLLIFPPSIFLFFKSFLFFSWRILKLQPLVNLIRWSWLN